ncbi:uncharacterized protein LOC127092367 [Lathyrus oleraceus]|uniref:uncharacterized protein LOC127092367 n=1 Tax=Pisum sativum TaxID=3888 RepID=UPI0021D25833|nr:uncharacterized protein LOC127092367 [Pisum sativum]
MVGVTSTEKTYSVGFVFLEFEKEDNFTWALEVCQTLLKDQGEMPKSIVTDCNTALMTLVAKIFPSSNALLCRYRITKNVGSQVKPAVGKKQIESEDGKIVKLVGNISRASLNYIFHEAKRADNVGSDSAKCECKIMKIYGLPCACVTAKKVKLCDPINMNEVCTHWKRLRFDDDSVMNDGKLNIFILIEREVIQERFLKADDNMKLHIKEQLRKISYPETTDMKSTSQPVKTKGSPKKMKPIPNDNSTTRSPSYFEYVDKNFLDSSTPKSQKSVVIGARISKPPLTPPQPKIPFIDEISVFMHKYIEQIVNVVRDVNCRYRAILTLLGKGEDSHTLVFHQLIQELRTHKELYTRLYGKKEHFDEVYKYIVPCLSGPDPNTKWTRFLEMDRIISYAYDRACVDLTPYSFSETFFPMRTAPPQNPNDHIMCIGWLSK